MPDINDVRQICLALPGVSERTSGGKAAWFAATLMARIWDEGVLTVKSLEREALAAVNPQVFFWTAHHDRSPLLVLVRLDLVDPRELRELLLESHRIASG